MESLVSDIPAGYGKNDNHFLQCIIVEKFTFEKYFMKIFGKLTWRAYPRGPWRPAE